MFGESGDGGRDGVRAERGGAGLGAEGSEFIFNTQKLGIYIHWPFCESKCPYCNFNTYVRRDEDLQERYGKALLKELSHYAERLGPREVGSIFFGGGTPSMMRAGLVGDILERIAGSWKVCRDVEVTLEANPGSADMGRFLGYREAGVNRLSLGVQALDDNALKKLGRLHDVATAHWAIEGGQGIFPHVSVDLIYARPGQGVSEWQRELGEALALGVGHLSLYQLTIEKGTPFGDLHRNGRLSIPEGLEARVFLETNWDMCAASGLFAYEVSNCARPGEESRHNLLYWRYGEYVGIGAGAHGRLVLDGKRYATQGIMLPEEWIEAVEKEGTGTVREELSGRDAGVEFLLTGLRLGEGIDLERYRSVSGRRLKEEMLERLCSLGMMETREDGRMATTREGRCVLDRIVLELIGEEE